MASMDARKDMVEPHGSADDHGDAGGKGAEDDHGHAEPALGPIDAQRWSAVAFGVALGLLVVLALKLSLS
jgi:hypothetical protein